MGLNTFHINVPSAPQAFALREQLVADGLKWPTDYRWQYHPAQTDWEYNNHVSAWVEFTFADPKLATYYRLKWTET